jgi:hypothetical protein
MINKHGRRFSLQKCMERVKMYEFTMGITTHSKTILRAERSNLHAITNLPCYRISTVTEVSCVFPSHLKKQKTVEAI